MIDNASKIVCDLLFYSNDEKYAEHIRKYQGCPTIAVSSGGRIFLGWYSGGRCEPHMDNYNILVYSDDMGKSWSQPVLIIPSNKEKLIHAIDIQLWIAPDGKLHVFWVQNNTEVAEIGKNGNYVDGYLFEDKTHAEWELICDNPDAEKPVFSKPRYLDKGFLRCKPLVLNNGRWINFNYSQDSIYYEYSISDDNGETWSKAVPSGIDNPNTRFFISRTPSGNILLVNNDHKTSRTNMTVYLSEDDGVTWKYKRCIDTREHLSYPDVDFYDGKIYLTYDRERTGEAEILFTSFTEEDIKNENYKFEINIVSKP